MSDLRSKIIRLAYEKPEYRDQLLPLVQKTAGGKARAEISTKMNGVTIYLEAKAQSGSLTGPFVTSSSLNADWKNLAKIVQKAIKALRGSKEFYLRDLKQADPFNGVQLALNKMEVFAWISWDGADHRPGLPMTLRDALPDIKKALESIGLAVTVK